MLEKFLILYLLSTFWMLSFLRLVAYEFKLPLSGILARKTLKNVFLTFIIFFLSPLYMINLLVVRSIQKVFRFILGDGDGF